MKSEVYEDLRIAKHLYDGGDPDGAWALVQSRLADEPDNVPALLLGYAIQDKARHWGLSYQIAARAIDLAPKMAAAWINFGKAAQSINRYDEAEKAHKTAIHLSVRPEAQLSCFINTSALYADMGRYEECAEYAKKALEIDPENRKALGNLGLAQLGLHQWAEGWKNYGVIIGSGVRKLVQYDQEPQWDGTPNQRIVVYGEQGIGDELSFASMIPDAIKVSRKVVIDCDKRLVGLFSRSFPEATVYGTRWDHDTYNGAEWEDHDRHPQGSIISGHLGSIFRNKTEDFPGTPYLVPDPERVSMWREFFKTKRKPVIGIAWSGGLSWTGARFRKWALEELQPIFNAVDAHWVSLQYRDCAKEVAEFQGAEIHDYPWATRTKDYDDTAALVANCDLVIGMQTSVMHLAAAMGVSTWCFVSRFRQWRYGQDSIPWYRSMRLYRQAEDGSWPIEHAARVLKLRYAELKRA